MGDSFFMMAKERHSTSGRELGRGEFSITYLCTDKETDEILDCKSISKRKLRTAIDIEDVRREVAIMNNLPQHPNIVTLKMKNFPRHTNIVTLKATYEDEHVVHLVMERCEGGELFDKIVARGHYSKRVAAAVTHTIVEVVQMCHKNGVMHRDLKPENFLFANKKENLALKAIDFDLSVFFKLGEQFSKIVGSPYYMAPEVLKRNSGPEVDVWSAGVILYILLCGVPPFWDVACPLSSTQTGVASMAYSSTLGRHLARRLVEVGVGDVFFIPGDFNLTLLDHLLAEPGLNLISCCNELNAGYAADGYAQIMIQRRGACAVTFTVGGLSVINDIAGAYSENLPIICIVGGPNSNDYGTNRILYHTIGVLDFSQEYRCFQTVTCAQVIVSHLEDAQELIDYAISTTLLERNPVYINIS